MQEKRNYAFFQNTQCEYFPCHKTGKPEDFNCLFCYCPLYALGRKCKGNFYYKGDIKVCTDCMVPHRRENYDYVIGRYSELVEMMRIVESGEENKDEKSID